MEDDDRREAAIAASPVFESNFQSEHVTRDQLQKLKELRRRRLQIKKTGPTFKKRNDEEAIAVKATIAGEAIVKGDIIEKHQLKNIVAAGLYPYVGNGDAHATGQEQEGPLPQKRRQKLHWGLDTKERWERKGNM